MFDPQLKLLARSLLEFPTALSEEEYYQILSALLTHLNVNPPGNLRLLAHYDKERHLLKYLIQHYDERNGDFLIRQDQLYPKIEEKLFYLLDNFDIIKATIIRALGQLGIKDDRVVRALRGALKHTHSWTRDDKDAREVRWEAARALGRLGRLGRLGSYAFELVIDLLGLAMGWEEEHRDVRQAAVHTLGQLGIKDKWVIDAFFLARNRNWNFLSQLEKVQSLQQLGIKGEEVAMAFRNAIDFKVIDKGVFPFEWPRVLEDLGIQDEQVTDALLRGMGWEDPAIRIASARALGKMGVKDERVVEALLRALGDEDHGMRLVAAKALVRLGCKDERVVETLLRALGDEDRGMRLVAAKALVRLGCKDEEVVEPLLRALENEHRNVRLDDRVEAARALGQLGVKNEWVVDALLRAMGDANPEVGRAAADALRQLGSTDKLLKDFLVDVHTPKTLNWMQKYLRPDFRFDEIPRRMVVTKAAWPRVLGHMGIENEPVVTALFGALGDKDREVRGEAALALGQLGIQDERVVNALLEEATISCPPPEIYYVSPREGFAAVTLLRLLFFHQLGLSHLEAYNRRGCSNERLVITAVSRDPQPVFDTPHAIPMIIQGFLNEGSADSIYYGLLFFSITELRLDIVGELLAALSDPDQDERTKQVIFQLLLRVELIEDRSS